MYPKLGQHLHWGKKTKQKKYKKNVYSKYEMYA